jgi:hypothetical protein
MRITDKFYVELLWCNIVRGALRRNLRMYIHNTSTNTSEKCCKKQWKHIYRVSCFFEDHHNLQLERFHNNAFDKRQSWMNASRSVVGSHLLTNKILSEKDFSWKMKIVFSPTQELNSRNIWEKQQKLNDMMEKERRNSSCLFCCFSIIHRTSLYRFLYDFFFIFVFVLQK